ncbi:helix-turn-helix domain-containing protein [Lacinutrix neustonica]|uniref:Helix-turn-helix domain-containing protein n=1 Tax=Lacinutrix neustonica TaxID=2980107 RepID=A0A9E8MT96_9FLAO|nr:AraC family transcriptional regulator [Lacinutrix neustonica]WAC01013.1 helix-turn-helix domain-containing protein [Lacinutrix neustonica]
MSLKTFLKNKIFYHKCFRILSLSLLITVCFSVDAQNQQLKDSIKKYIYNNREKTEYFNKQLFTLSESKNNEEDLSWSYMIYAIMHELSNDLDSTVFYYQKALDRSSTPSDIIDYTYSIGVIYEAKRDYERALRLYNEALSIASENNLESKKEDIRLSITSIRNKVNGTLESITQLLAAYDKYADDKTSIRYIRKKLIDGYVANSLYDKALIHIEEGLKQASEENNSEYLYYLNELKGKCYLNKKEYKRSHEALEIAIKHANILDNELFLDNTNYVLAEVKNRQRKTKESIVLIKNILQREDEKSSEERYKYYNLLAENYKLLDSSDVSNTYYKKSIKEREKASIERIETLEKIYKISLGEEITETKEQKTKKKYWIIAFVILLFTAIVLFFRYIKIKRKDQIAFDALFRKVKDYENKSAHLDIDLVIKDLSKKANSEAKKLKVETAETKEAISKTNRFVLDKAKVGKILKKIKKLEQEHYFLRKDCNMHNMAKALGTNTSYLSKIVNEHLNKSFSKYINDLRIDYAVVELKNSSRLRAYSVAAIAEEFGYKNADSFSSYFKSVTGITPSVYIKKIKSIRTS